ncbi:hypothetical protein MK489_10390 [Myxococcota bacterium]|nr:hypothetical protein [Myxococcota bacterium]
MGVRSRNAGFSLPEVFIAMGILAFGLLALAAMQLKALSDGASGKHTSDAAAVARTILEQVHRLPWSTLDAASAAGAWTAPAWTGAGSPVDRVVAVPSGGGAVVEKSYDVAWKVDDIAASNCLRDVEVRVSWSEVDFPAPKSLSLATRRYNYGDPSC